MTKFGLPHKSKGSLPVPSLLLHELAFTIDVKADSIDIFPIIPIRESMKTIPRSAIRYHITAWVIFIVYEVSLVLLLGSKGSWLEFAAYYILHIVLFYATCLIALPFTERFKPRWPAVSAVLIISLCIYTLLIVSLSAVMISNQHIRYSPWMDRNSWIKSVWRSAYFLSLSFCYWYFARAFALEKMALTTQKEKAEIRARLIKAQNAYLLSRISPHLLFNTLNYIYNSLDQSEAKASESIILLTDTMRYSLSDPDPDGKVPLLAELDQIDRFIQLHQLRFDNRLSLQYSCALRTDDASLRIPPLLLLTFVENIFTHGDLQDALHPASIQIAVDANTLSFIATNKKRAGRIHPGHGIGIANAKERLALQYESHRYSLQVNDEAETYNVYLKLIL